MTQRLSMVLVCGWLVGIPAGLAADTVNPQKELAAAEQRLAELRLRCKEKHPLVQAELRQVEEWQARIQLANSRNIELELARKQLADLRRVCKEKHPLIQAQLIKISTMEKGVATSMSGKQTSAN